MPFEFGAFVIFLYLKSLYPIADLKSNTFCRFKALTLTKSERHNCVQKIFEPFSKSRVKVRPLLDGIQ